MAKTTPLIAGIDCGTASIRALIFDLQGKPVAHAAAKTPVKPIGAGQAQHDATSLWRTTRKVLHQAIAQIDNPKAIQSLGVASFGETGLFIDAKDQALTPVLAWFDSRTTTDLAQFTANFGRDRLMAITGLCPNPIFSLLKWRWLRRHFAQARDRNARWLMVSDWLAFKLCGEMATDLSLASRTMALDLSKTVWSSEILDAIDMHQDQLPPIVGTGTRLGTVKADIAQDLGLPRHCTIGVCGHDHIAGLIAVAANRPSTLLDSMGSAEILTFVQDRPRQAKELTSQGFNQGLIHTDRPMAYTLAGLPTSGAAIAWFNKLHPERSLDELVQMAEMAGQSHDLLFLPHLRIGSPPNPDPVSRAAWLGLSDATDPALMFRAVIEGIALQTAHMRDILITDHHYPKPEVIIAIGGGTQNRLLMQCKANLFQQPIQITNMPEATSLGAAMAGAVAAGLFPSLAEAQTAMPPATRQIDPQPDPRLLDKLALFGEACSQIRHIHQRLQSI